MFLVSSKKDKNGKKNGVLKLVAQKILSVFLPLKNHKITIQKSKTCLNAFNVIKKNALFFDIIKRFKKFMNF